MVKTYNKNLRRMFKSNILRLIAISAIISIGIAIVTGISAIPLQIRDALGNAELPLPQVFEINALADKVELIGFILPSFFILVALLTVLTTITRLVEEERPTFACYKTLGYSDSMIILRYVVFAFICTSFGCIGGLLFGNYLLKPAIYGAIISRYDLPNISGIHLTQGLIWSAIMTLIIVFTSIFIALNRCREKPANLLRPKAPKPGKKFFLEKIPFIWNHLKFKYKSTARNIWRFKGRLIMTVLSVAGSTIMLFLGFGLFSAINNTGNVQDVATFTGSMNAIAIVIIICAISLCVLVLFNLTNINIEERKREIATLKVLGYNQFETAWFIYRELMVLALIGIIIGLPSGYYLTGWLFDYIEFGSLDLVKWYAWVLTFAIAIVSVLIADALLYKKIRKIEMHTSLKTIE